MLLFHCVLFQEYDPSKHEPVLLEEEQSEEGSRQEQAKGNGPYGLGTHHYQEKYKHLLGGLECAKESAVKMEPNKKFGYGKLDFVLAEMFMYLTVHHDIV